jgi:hypothetical protein
MKVQLHDAQTWNPITDYTRKMSQAEKTSAAVIAGHQKKSLILTITANSWCGKLYKHVLLTRILATRRINISLR